MNKYLLYVAVFGIVCALLAQQGDAKSALKKRSLKSQKIDMSKVREKLSSSLDARKKRAAETPADKIRQKRSARALSSAGIAEKVKEVVPNIQKIDTKLSHTRKRRSANNELKTRMVNKLKKTNAGARKTRSADKKAPMFAKSQFSKLSKVASNLKRFQKK